MAKFRKKPVVVEAMRFRGVGIALTDIDYAMAFDTWLHVNRGERPCRYVGNTVVVPTLEGDMTASEGDWIILGVAGELYPCKPDIFEATYEPVP
jgi:hypothetical protein